MINLTLSDHNTFKNIKVAEKTLKGLKQQEDYQFISNACKISSCSCSPCDSEIALTKALTSEMFPTMNTTRFRADAVLKCGYLRNMSRLSQLR